MNELDATFAQLMENLRQLEATLSQEQALLSAGQVNAALLHRVTEDKNEQLATLHHLDSQRERLAVETGAGQPPYADNRVLSRQWLQMLELTERLNQNNYRNGLLLAQHLMLNQQMLSMLEQHQTRRRLYGPDGQSCAGQSLGRKFSV